ncbi:MAG TPA: hypothetical protein VN454_02475 [Candidatus Angelobacter sp.]|nr:hypothetical protein [Candidatus Angelobacter sp.]
MTKNCSRMAVLILLFSAAAHAQCATGGLAVIVNKSNPVESLSMAQLRRVVLGDVRAWPDHKPVSLVAKDPTSKTFQCMISSIVRLSVAEYRRYIMNAEFRGDEPMSIRNADSDVFAANIVSQLPGGIAIVGANSVAAIGANVKVVKVDGKAVGQLGYPL